MLKYFRPRALALGVGFVVAAVLLYPFAASLDVRVHYANSFALLKSRFSPPSYVLVGDSITKGGGLWFIPLRTNPLSVVNLARSGATTEQIYPLVKQALKLHPRAVLYMAGTNDALLDDVHPEKQLSYFKQSMEDIKQAGAHVIVTLPPPTSSPETNRRILETRALIAKIAKSFGADVIDLWSDMTENGVIKPELTLDGVHFTRRAYSIWLEAIRQRLDG
ncbi:hypothetical protein ACVWZK_006389 [Bradyrhizobium sp. GM0.4]